MEFCLRAFKKPAKIPGDAGLDEYKPIEGIEIHKKRFEAIEEIGSFDYDLVIPQSVNTKQIILYVHGGGFNSGSPEEYRSLTSRLAKQSGLPVYVPAYTLTRVYPAALDQILVFAHWLTMKDKEIILAGDSAGGTIATSAGLVVPGLFKRVILLSPWLDLGSDLYSYVSRAFDPKNNTGDPIFTANAEENKKESLEMAMHYLGEEGKLDDPIANPFIVDDKRLKDFPPVIAFVGDRESIMDGALYFLGRLQHMGKPATAYVYEGMWHVFQMYAQGCGGDKKLKPALDSMRIIADYARLGKAKEPEKPYVDVKMALLPEN